MKNTGCSTSPVPVYFYVQQETRLAGIPLGNFSLTRGSGDFKTILDAENLKDSGYRLQDVKGIYIPLTERMMLVSQWDDDEFHLEDFVELAETEPKVQDPPTLLAADTSIPAKNADNLPSAQTADNSSSIQDAKTKTLKKISPLKIAKLHRQRNIQIYPHLYRTAKFPPPARI